MQSNGQNCMHQMQQFYLAYPYTLSIVRNDTVAAYARDRRHTHKQKNYYKTEKNRLHLKFIPSIYGFVANIYYTSIASNGLLMEF